MEEVQSFLGSGNFEEWLGYLFNASSLSSNDKSPIRSVRWKDDTDLTADGEKQLRRFIERAIFAECALELDRRELSGSAGEGDSSGHIPFLAKLIARDATLGRTHLFTLNYDTLFEQAMEELGIQYFDGFSGKANSRSIPLCTASMSIIPAMSPKGECVGLTSSYSFTSSTARSTGAWMRQAGSERSTRNWPSLSISRCRREG